MPNPARQNPCGCIDNFISNTVFTELCPQHLAIVNSQGSRPPQGMTPQQMPASTTTGGIPSHPFAQFQMGGFAHPFQMPPQVLHVRRPQ